MSNTSAATAQTGGKQDPSEGAEGDTTGDSRWPVVGLAGGLSLCCVFAAPAATGVASGTAAGGATAALGGGTIRVAVAALTVGLVAVSLRKL
ncbi:hypothetical protein [Halobacterium rubrum]|uniref:hypothetical protein n=1 Tax=Halobacterium TaxID=2239 RepID=UPI001F48554B|nr:MULTISPECIES: hypothetical protein [Halobacterium]MDH5020112.1 hypothetical protein [Halobacterium rubrum]